jgi:hypothetical protein
MKKNDVFQFITTFNQMRTLYDEIFSLSQKKPNDPINKFKLNLINQILSISNLLLKKEFKPFPDFNLFDESDMPSNSDVTVMLSQYLDSMERFRSKNIKKGYNQEWTWIIDEDKETDIKTYEPINRYRRVK